MINTAEKKTPIFGISEAVIISLATGFAYCVGLAYDEGAALFYNIPAIFIYVPTSQLIGLAIVLIFVVGLPAGVLLHAPPSRIIELAKSAQSRIDFAAVSIGTAAVALVSVFLSVPWLWLGVVAGILTGLLSRPVERLCALYRLPKSKRTWKRASRAVIISEMRRERRATPSGILAFYVVHLVVVTLALALTLGYWITARQADYAILQSGPFTGYAIVWVLSNDLYVGEKYDAKLSTLSTDFVAIKVEASHPVHWTTMHTGVLTVVGPRLF